MGWLAPASSRTTILPPTPFKLCDDEPEWGQLGKVAGEEIWEKEQVCVYVCVWMDDGASLDAMHPNRLSHSDHVGDIDFIRKNESRILYTL